MYFVIPNIDIDTKQLMVLRKITKAGLGDIKRAAADQTSVLTIEPFGTDWEENRKVLTSLYQLLKQDASFSLLEGETLEAAESMSVYDVFNELLVLRETELATQRQSALEQGEIQHLEQYIVNDDENWLPKE